MLKVAFLSALTVLAGTGFGAAQTAELQGGGAAVALSPRLQFSADEMALARAVADQPALADFYGGNALKRVFTGPEAEPLRAALRATVATAPDHGLPVSRYRPQNLAVAGQGLADEVLYASVLARFIHDMTGGVIRPASADAQIVRMVHRPPTARLMQDFTTSADPAAYLAGLAPKLPAYRALQAALQGRGEFVVSADLPPAPEAVWRVGMQGGGVVPLRDRLADIGFEAAVTDPRDYDQALSQAVYRYQQAVGLEPDGVAGPNTIRRLNARGDDHSRAIMVGLERLRWMGDMDPQARMVWVNIPEFTARILDGGHEVFRTRTVVGKTDPSMRTPEFSDQMEYVVVNPRWNVPRSITVREYLPRLQANRNSVSHLDVVDGRGRVVPRSKVDFSRYTAATFPYRLQQKPSDDNALGLVKFIFPNPWNIYLHDTPTKYLFGNSVRANSHGCIRIGDPFDLAYQLLSQQTDDPQAMFRRALDGGAERWLKLTPTVPVHLVYFTAYPDETGRIRYFNDIYGRDAEVWAQLQKAGLDSGAQTE